MRIRVEPHKCIGAGLCVGAAPQLFEQNEDDGIVILLEEHPNDAQQEPARKAARLCPALAIHIDSAE